MASFQLVCFLTLLAGVATTTTEVPVSCSKCSTGQPLTSVSVNDSSSVDCLSGHLVPVLLNEKCDCQWQCARESHQPCQVSNSQSICDHLFKLKCHNESQLCLGHFMLRLSDISSGSVLANWTLSSGKKEFVQLLIADYNPRRFPNESHFIPIKANVNQLDKTNFSAKIEDLKANVTYVLKLAHLADEEFAIFRTKEQLIETLPKVLVTNRNSSSISIAFDDFKPSSYDSGYAIHYRLASPVVPNLTPPAWNIVKSNHSPFFVLPGLHPNTRYQIQVSTWSTFDELEHKSEIIDAVTLDGCVFENRTFEINDRVLADCDQQCTCIENGNLYCTERCSDSYISVKVAKVKNLECVPHATDECCVRCIGNDTKKFIDKPGLCPKIAVSGGGGGNASSCAKTNDCAHDYHCTGIEKCCRNKCGKLSCLTPLNVTIPIDQCPFECGPNSRCKYLEEESQHRCICLEGFTSIDPLQGCQPNKPTKTHQCDFHNQTTYSIGEHFEHQCEQCVCTEALEVECKPKCVQFNESELPANCQLVPDSGDPICCKKRICEVIPESTRQPAIHNGCYHLNHTYSVNETFHLGCELKCLCKANEQVECVPRCFEDPGYDKDFCFLRPDPDDPECCKISVCNHNNTFLKPDFLIEMAESLNSTTIKLNVLLNFTHNDNDVRLFYRQILPNETEIDASGNGGALWTNRTLTPEMILATPVGSPPQSKEVILTGLQPETDYSIYFMASGGDVSNTVVVRTFPSGIDHTFKGCFHGGQIIEVGEVFESDCEYKCVCREGNIRECVERCPVYIDLIGYENCKWIQSTEDPCCTIPICETKESQCTTEDGKSFKVGDTWTLGFGCLKKTCTCVTDEFNMTEIRCKSGCPEIPPSVLKPTAECASPQIFRPKDPCVCPYVVCKNNINPLDLPERAIATKAKDFCEFKGDKISIGEEFYDKCHAICRCEMGGQLNCHPIQCNAFGPHTAPHCLEWDIDPSFIPMPPNCCPEPKCKNDGSCSYAGIRFGNYKHIPQELLPCGKRCICNNGQIHCENTCPEIGDEPPLSLPCPTSLAFRGHLPGDNCCIHWQCRNTYKDRMSKSFPILIDPNCFVEGNCVYNDKRYKLGEQWDETETGVKRRCQCKITNEIFHVVCNPGHCQQITEKYLEPNSDCSTPTVFVPKDAIVCPYVICNNTKEQGGEIEHLDVVAINATSARIRFTIPPLYVGLLGHAEVHYTTDMNIPHSQWNIQKFARPKRLFDTANIEYHLGNLKPDTTYFLQIEVIVEALKTGPLSDIYRLYLPPMPVTRAPTTTTTTSTLPPIIMLDMKLDTELIDPTTVRVSWRPFTAQEKKFIDGMQIRYKKSDADMEAEWAYSGILHRSTNVYEIKSLQPGATYMIDLMFTSIDGVKSNIVSTKQAMIDIPPAVRNEYQFDVHIYPDDVTINEGHVDVEARHLPTPVNKYIQVAKVFYQNMDTSETLHHFVNVDESGKLSFANLHPNTRYKVWIDFYLTNGQVVSSNSIEIITTYGKSHGLEENDVGALMSGQFADSKYLISFMLISLFVFLTGTGFMIVACIFVRRHSTASITRVCISEAAYDNPTYKTFDAGEKGCMEDSLSKSDTLPAK